MWYLNPPAQPSMPQVVLTLVQPISIESRPPPCPQKPSTAPAPPLSHPRRAREKTRKETAEPRQTPTCVVCDVQGHANQSFPNIPILFAHLDSMDTIENIPVGFLMSGPTLKNKSLRMKHACFVSKLYGHYSHHYQYLPNFLMALDKPRNHALESRITLIEEIHPHPFTQTPCPSTWCLVP